MNYKKKKTYYIISALITIIAIVGFSYAYYEGSINNNAEIDISLGFEGGYRFETDHLVNYINSFITDLDMFQAGDNKLVLDAEQKIKISLLNEDAVKRSCSYDIVWHWDTDSDNYVKTSGADKEFTIVINGVEVQLPNTSEGSKVIGASGIQGTIDTTTAQEKYEVASIRFYNLKDYDQSAHANKEYKGYLKIENVICDENVVEVGTLSNAIINQVSDMEYTSSQDGNVYRVFEENGVRYAGSNPNNYIWYNNEMWRIIGVFDGAEIGLTSGKKYTKIIKDTSLGRYKWSNANSTDWASSYLNQTLNEDYLNSKGSFSDIGLSQSAKSLIANENGRYSNWNIGRITGVLYRKASTWYNHEKTNTYSAALGLMSGTDYGYATYGNKEDILCDGSALTLYGDAHTSCAANYNWLYNGEAAQWSITVIDDINVIYVRASTGGFHTAYPANNSFLVRPTLYLDDEVILTDGTGSKTSPYKVSKPMVTLSGQVLALEGETEYMSELDSDFLSDNAYNPNNINVKGTTEYSLARYEVKHVYVTQNGVTHDAGVRYRGASPNNYIEFNSDQWRIIGTFEGSTIGMEAGKYYTKIIYDDEKLQDIFWKDDYIGWDEFSNRLNTTSYFQEMNESLSNNEFYSITENQNMIANALWYQYLMDEIDSQRSFESLLGIYSEERNINSNYSSQYQPFRSKVAIPSLSDYLLGYESFGLVSPDEQFFSCSGLNEFGWIGGLFAENISYMAFLNFARYKTITIDSNQLCIDYYDEYSYEEGREVTYNPTLYLESNVVISSGDGTSKNPYKITQGNNYELSDSILYGNNVHSDENINFDKGDNNEPDSGLFYTSVNTEDNKPTYYFRGDIDNNYVKFGTNSRTVCMRGGKEVYQLEYSEDLETDWSATMVSKKTTDSCEEGNLFYLKNYITGEERWVEDHLGEIPAGIYITNFGGGSYGYEGWGEGDATEWVTVEEPLYWRIVRINEDGSVRMIYNGTSPNATGADITIGQSQFDDVYAHYTLDDNTNSDVKTIVDNWYASNLTNYTKYLSTTAGFCNDQTIDMGTYYDANDYIYDAVNRLNAYAPQFKCQNEEFLYTTIGSTIGNKNLQYPIGLITADEVMYSGTRVLGVTDDHYWTMTPKNVLPPGGETYTVYENLSYNETGNSVVAFEVYVRPVINLKGNVKVTGSGTSTDPYVVLTD